MRLLPLLSGAVAAVAFSACSTVVNSPLQYVSVRSRPAGAEVELDGIAKGNTPVRLEVSRWDDHLVAISLPGYRAYTVRLKRKLNPWVFGNIFNGIIPGLIVDASTGAIYQLEPRAVEVDLVGRARGIGRREAGAATALPGELLVTTVLKADPSWRKIAQMERL